MFLSSLTMPYNPKRNVRAIDGDTINRKAGDLAVSKGLREAKAAILGDGFVTTAYVHPNLQPTFPPYPEGLYLSFP